MEQRDSTPKSPTRIPRPRFTAPGAAPRTPSIRAVPYRHSDRVAPASWTADKYSSSNWPFPHSTKSSSSDMSSTATEDAEASRNMNGTVRIRPGHRATASGPATTSTKGENIRPTPDDGLSGIVARADVSFTSVETQIYAPRSSGGDVIVECEKPVAFNDHNMSKNNQSFLVPTADLPERPMTPTPYSSVPKAAPTTTGSTSETEDGAPECTRVMRSGHQRTQGSTRHPMAASSGGPENSGAEIKNPVTEDGCESDDDVDAKDDSGNGNHTSETAHAAPMLRDDEGRILSRRHPLSKAGSLSPQGEPRQARDATPSASSNCSAKAEYGGSDAETVAGTPRGIVVLKEFESTTRTIADEEEEAAVVDVPAARDGSLLSRRPATIREEEEGREGEGEMPDLESLRSLRRGPRIRHSRLPPSPSTAAKAGGGVPRVTKQLWGAVGHTRRVMFTLAILLELSILSLASSVTAVVFSHVSYGDAAAGLVVWACVSGGAVIALGVLSSVCCLRYRGLSKDLVSGENWIEMHIRSRPLPPRPQSELRKQDAGATEAWSKFVQDHEQLRRYVEFLESRIGVLEEGRPSAAGTGAAAPDTRVAGAAGEAGGGETETRAGRPGSSGSGRAGNVNVRVNREDHAPNSKGRASAQAPALNPLDSWTPRQLLRPEDSIAETEPWEPGAGRAAVVPKSDTKTSILTELCAAVTEGYSPLSEQAPSRGSALVLPGTPNDHTPSSRARGNALRHIKPESRACSHQGGVRPAEGPEKGN